MIRNIQLGKIIPPESLPYRPEVHQLLYVFDKPKGEKKVMPIKRIAVTELPEKSSRGSIIPEVQEVMDALNNLPANQAIAVELSTETTVRLGKGKGDKTRSPYRVFASTLKRHFKNNGLGFEAFASDEKKSVFIRRVNAPANNAPAPSNKKK